MYRVIGIKNDKIRYYLSNGVFEPNLTTKLLIESIKVKKNSKILELGCGCGIISLFLLNKNTLNHKIHLSDLSLKAVKNAIFNLKKYKNRFICLQSNLFKKWSGNKYDLIINDVSGISKKLSKISPWFKKIPCDNSDDGTELSINFLNEASNYLEKHGRIYFPILSLSNSKKILNFAKKKFRNIKIEKTSEWPLPKSLLKHMTFLKKIEKLGYIRLKIKYGIILAETKIYSGERK
jgi:hypothetical protein